MIRTTLWKPDTCKCAIEYEWDDAVPQDIRTHSFERFINQCQHHTEVDWSKALQHNQEKNQTLATIKQTYPELLKADGEFADDVAPSWEIKNGEMVVSVNRVTKTGITKII